ncbi:hypothetical protein [Leptolyngbya sp. KIOST-1]|uniref:hypothetical protein n=1 Tax=Leptolyngbya sp. KIOST-1 TaxID=1229172 RepID=UPI0012E02EAB|nr:hypothetical protein [Leptolyngbya sp. KIOST-1]
MRHYRAAFGLDNWSKKADRAALGGKTRELFYLPYGAFCAREIYNYQPIGYVKFIVKLSKSGKTRTELILMGTPPLWGEKKSNLELGFLGGINLPPALK